MTYVTGKFNCDGYKRDVLTQESTFNAWLEHKMDEGKKKILVIGFVIICVAALAYSMKSTFF